MYTRKRNATFDLRWCFALLIALLCASCSAATIDPDADPGLGDELYDPDDIRDPDDMRDPEDDEPVPTPSTALCDHVDCGFGSCVVVAEEAACLCDENFTGDDCTTCTEGYTGEHCRDCAEGYIEDENGRCIVDLCLEVVCDGACDIVKGEAICTPLSCLGNDCLGHGTCVDRDGVGVCLCDEGYQGRACSGCEAGYEQDDAGNCVLSACFGIDCGAGTCNSDGQKPLCECPQGFADAACTVCEAGYVLSTDGQSCDLTIPSFRSLSAWFDLADTQSVTMGKPQHVDKVHDKRPAVKKSLWAPYESTQPRYLAAYDAARFQHQDHMLVSYYDYFARDEYTIYLVAEWTAQRAQDILATHKSDDNDWEAQVGLSLKVLSNGRVRAEHHGTFKPAEADAVEADFFTHAKKQLIKVSRRAFLNGSVLILSNGEKTAQVEAKTGPFSKSAISVFGTNIPYYGNAPFQGNLHEVIVVRGNVSAANDQHIEAYLKAKWGL